MKIRLLIALLSIGLLLFIWRPQDPWAKKAALETPSAMEALANTPNEVPNWPPREGAEWPAPKLYNPDGTAFNNDQLIGKPSLVEIVSMTCAGCQAFSGGNIHGGFGGFPAQNGLLSLEEYYANYTGGEKITSDRVNFVQILIYNLKLRPATPQDAGAWRDHFELTGSNTHILTGDPTLANGASFRMIPGFFLLNSERIVLFDSTGHQPKRSLYLELLPGMRNLLRGRQDGS